MLTLSEDAAALGVQAKWIDHLVSCGLRIARYASKLEGKRLVLALSVPQRDYAALLIACGWVLGAQRPGISDPRAFLEKVQSGEIVRFVDKKKVVAAKLFRIEEESERTVLITDQCKRSVDQLTAISGLSDDTEPLETPCRQDRPEPGSLARMAGIDSVWDSWLVSLPSDLAIIGTRSWIERELSSCIRRSEDEGIGNNEIRTVLFPKDQSAVVWNTRIVSHVDRETCLDLPKTISAVILDGNGAIKYLPDLQAKIVICILDRSTATESAEEFIVQYKNTRGIPVSLSEIHEWKTLPGIEYMAFEVRL